VDAKDSTDPKVATIEVAQSARAIARLLTCNSLAGLVNKQPIPFLYPLASPLLLQIAELVVPSTADQ
jgi:hypothetical protein